MKFRINSHETCNNLQSFKNLDTIKKQVWSKQNISWQPDDAFDAAKNTEKSIKREKYNHMIEKEMRIMERTVRQLVWCC